LGINQFADMTQEEFRVKHLGYTMSKKLSSTVSEVPSAVALPDAVDWRAKNAVGPVKNQGQCGGCWSFSTTGAIEGAWAIATGQLLSLSEQQLIDCSAAQGNKGCNGGDMDQAFNYVIKHKGICAEDAYPFVAKQGTCRKCTSVAHVSGFKDVTPNSEDALQAAAAQQPVSIAIEADQHVFQFYSTGVLDSADCGTNLDHAVLLAGYGSDGGKDFWLVKNSWGPTWGMAGYIQIVRNVGPSGTHPLLCGGLDVSPCFSHHVS
jgi:C1A family cysteine protease